MSIAIFKKQGRMTTPNGVASKTLKNPPGLPWTKNIRIGNHKRLNGTERFLHNFMEGKWLHAKAMVELIPEICMAGQPRKDNNNGIKIAAPMPAIARTIDTSARIPTNFQKDFW